MDPFGVKNILSVILRCAKGLSVQSPELYIRIYRCVLGVTFPRSESLGITKQSPPKGRNFTYLEDPGIISLGINRHILRWWARGVFHHLRNARYLGSMKPFSVSVIGSLGYEVILVKSYEQKWQYGTFPKINPIYYHSCFAQRHWIITYIFPKLIESPRYHRITHRISCLYTYM